MGYAPSIITKDTKVEVGIFGVFCSDCRDYSDSKDSNPKIVQKFSYQLSCPLPLVERYVKENF